MIKVNINIQRTNLIYGLHGIISVKTRKNNLIIHKVR